MRDSRRRSPRIQAPARSSGSGGGRSRASSSEGVANAASGGAATPPRRPHREALHEELLRQVVGPVSDPPVESNPGACPTPAPRAAGARARRAATTSPRERPRRRIRSVRPASISAPRAARPAGAATRRTRSVPSTWERSAGRDASQTVPRFTIVAPRASRIAARISGSSLLPSPRLRRIMVHAVEEAPVQLFDRFVALPADERALCPAC